MDKLSYIDDHYRLPLLINRFTGGQHPVRQYHEHAFSEIAFILKGTGYHLSNGRCCEFIPGDVLLIHPGTAHAYDHDQSSLELINVMYDHKKLLLPQLDINRFVLFEKFFPHSSDMTNLDISPEPIIHLNENESAEIAELLEKLSLEINSITNGHLFASVAIFMQLLLTLCRCGDQKNSFIPNEQNINAAINYMNCQFTENIRISDIAAHAGLSERNLFRYFQSATGYSPNIYLLRLRINKAANMLINSNLSISEIAYSCGFCDGNYFSKKFKEFTGSTPGNFRKGKIS